MLRRALTSVVGQTQLPAAVIVEHDYDRTGAPATRQRALEKATTRWCAFLDDDDEFMPHHLQALMSCAQLSGADFVYSYFMIKDAAGNEQPDNDPLGTFGMPFDPLHPVQTTVTTLVRTELAKDVGGFLRPSPAPPTPDGHRAGEDWSFTLGCVEAGAKIVHLPERTWWWWHWGSGSPGIPGNTSGLPCRW
jgi:hypothetical protein